MLTAISALRAPDGHPRMRRSRPDESRSRRIARGWWLVGRLCLIVICAGTPLSILGASSALAVTLSLPANAGAPAGSSATVPLSIDDATGALGIDILITYDPAVALATAVSRTTLSSGQTLTYNLSPPGSIRISLFGATPLIGGGVLLTIDFNSAGPTDSHTPLDLQSAAINEGAIPAVLVDGRYCVQGLPDEVRNLRLAPAAPGSTTAILTWSPDPFATTYNVYRGRRPDLSDLRCFLSGLGSTSTPDDGTIPVSGEAFFLLVTSMNCRAEGTLGFASSRDERVNSNPCP